MRKFRPTLSGLTLVIPALALAQAAPSPELAQLLSQEKSGRVRLILTQPTQTTLASVAYQFPEFVLNPGEVVFAEVPSQLRLRPVSQLGMGHRQDEHPRIRDPYPALSTLWIATTDPVNGWAYWAGPSSGKFGAKYAEPRATPEYDSLYEWPTRGYKDLQGQLHKDPVFAKALRLENTGVDDLLLSAIYLEVVPAPAHEYITMVFSPGSDFGDPQTLHGRRYGGGQHFQGTFPGANILASSFNTELDRKGMHLNGARGTIDLPVGKQLVSIDVMCGDTYPDHVRNKDGGIGSLGNAQLTVSHLSQGVETVLRSHVNVGPEGVESAFPLAPILIQEGDQLLIKNKSNASPLYLMAVRLGFN